MTLIEAQKRIFDLNTSFFQTQDICGCLKVSVSYASKILTRLESVGLLKKIARGKWMLASVIDPNTLVECLTAPYPSYISLQTALYHYGMISQIPSTTYAISLARSHRYNTPLGIISVHHIQSDFFHGYDYYKESMIKIASKEKALLDLLYLTPAKSNLFKALPELVIPKNFNIKSAIKMIETISVPRLKSIIYKRFNIIFDREQNISK